MPTIKYPNNPNVETAFVEQDDGTKNRVVLTAPQDISTIEYPSNPNSTKAYVTVNGKKQRVVMTADIAGGGGAVESVNGKTGAVVLTAEDVGALAQFDTMPTATAEMVGKIVQFTGTTDANYTNGYFYKCVSDGQTPATYSWEQTNVQPGGLPDQTGQSGKFLTTDGTNASWSDKPLVNKATTANALNISGQSSTANNYTSLQANVAAQDAVGIGYGASVSGIGGIAIGRGARATANYAIQLGGCNNATNTTANTLKVGVVSGNYELMSADGTVPTARLTKVNSTITLTAAGWSNSSQTVNVTGMTATGIVLVSPDPTDQADYTSASIICSAQAAGTLTFTCSTTPTNDIDVVVVML